MKDKYQLFIDSLADISKKENIELDMSLYLKELNRIGISDTDQENFLIFSKTNELFKEGKASSIPTNERQNLYKIENLSATRVVELNPHFNHFAPLCRISDNGYKYEPFGFLSGSECRRRILDSLIEQSPLSFREYDLYRYDISWFIFIITEEEVNCENNSIDLDLVRKIISFTECILDFEEKFPDVRDPYKKYVYFSMLGVCYFKLNKIDNAMKYLNKALSEQIIAIVEETPDDKYPYQFGEVELGIAHRYLAEIINRYYAFFIENRKNHNRILANAYKLEEIIKAFKYFIKNNPDNINLYFTFSFIWDIIYNAKKEAQKTDDLLNENNLDEYKFVKKCHEKIIADEKQPEEIKLYFNLLMSMKPDDLIYDIERLKDCYSGIQDIHSKYKVDVEKRGIISDLERKKMQQQMDTLRTDILIKDVLLDQFKDPEGKAEENLKSVLGVFWDLLEEASRKYLISADSILKYRSITNTHSKRRIYDDICRQLLMTVECELNCKIFTSFKNYLTSNLDDKYNKIVEDELKYSSPKFLVFLNKKRGTLSLGQIGVILGKSNLTKSNKIFAELWQFIVKNCKNKRILSNDFIAKINNWARFRDYIGHEYDPLTSYDDCKNFRDELIGDSKNPGWLLQFLEDLKR